MDEEIKISDETRHKLDCFKPIVDLILKEELTFENYVGLVLSRGINTMIRDIIPKDVEILLKSMVQLFNEYPDSTSQFIANILKEGEEIQLRERWFGEKTP